MHSVSADDGPYPDDLEDNTTPDGEPRNKSRRAHSATSAASAATSSATVRAATNLYLGKMGEVVSGESLVSRRTYQQALLHAQHEAHAQEAGERRLSVRFCIMQSIVLLTMYMPARFLPPVLTCSLLDGYEGCYDCCCVHISV